AEAVVVAEELGEDVVLEVVMKAEEKGVKAEVVPRGVEESKALMQAFGGYVALLSTPAWVLEVAEKEAGGRIFRNLNDLGRLN
ncbi:MAG: hypothetical protein RQ859_00970, partial [Pyrobaculum sp.]|nr:hypothetical protein [Pyrobaculum sp.]